MVPNRTETVKRHCDLYGEALDQARQLALGWFDKRLRQ